jgi:O-acetyl-ADP-ribose deacetylase (regulator of RNase III)
MRNEGRLDFLLGNIAESDCEAIVNPCNHSYIMGHAGVNGALAAAAGPDYAAECAELPDFMWRTALEADLDEIPRVTSTGAGTLKARHVIHAVSPTWNGGGHGELDELRRVHNRVLRAAVGRACRSVALPAIGTGANRFPPEVAASIAVPTVEAFLQYDSTLERVVFVFDSRATLHDYLARSSTPDQHNLLIASLRDEVMRHLRWAERVELAAMLDEITDEATLRAIVDEALGLIHTAAPGYHPGSVGIRWEYVRAAERILQPDT